MLIVIRKIVTFSILDQLVFYFEGDKKIPFPTWIYAIHASELFPKKHKVYLAYVLENEKEQSCLNNILTVRKFMDVFAIDLILRTRPISKPLYCMNLMNWKNLKIVARLIRQRIYSN